MGRGIDRLYAVQISLTVLPVMPRELIVYEPQNAGLFCTGISIGRDNLFADRFNSVGFGRCEKAESGTRPANGASGDCARDSDSAAKEGSTFHFHAFQPARILE